MSKMIPEIAKDERDFVDAIERAAKNTNITISLKEISRLFKERFGERFINGRIVELGLGQDHLELKIKF